LSTMLIYLKEGSKHC